MQKNAFVVYVFGAYEKYINYYIYFINLNYPNDDVVIFYQGNLSPKIKSIAIEFDNVILYENVFDQYEKIGGGGPKLLRWILPEEYFENYKYVYIGDVDILVLKEKESLFDFHSNQMKNFKTAFSNRVRPLKEGGLSKRLTGLHFIDVKPYYKAISTLAQKLREDTEFQNIFLNGLKRNEEVLYKIVKTAIGFDANEIVKMKRPLHGFHVGVVRVGKKLDSQTIRENSSIDPEEMVNQLTKALTDERFINIFTESFCDEIYFTYKQLKISLPFAIKKEAISFKLNKLISRIKNKLSN